MTVRPFVPLTVAFMVGISSGHFFPIENFTVQIALIISLSMALLTRIWSHRKPILYLLPLLVSFFLFGILEINLSQDPPIADNHVLHFIEDKKISAEGMICENPQVSPDKTELVISVTAVIRDGRSLPASGRVLLSVREPYPFRYGDFIRFHARLRIPRNFGNPGGFDYVRYLLYRGILVRGFIRDSTGFVVLRRNMGNPVRTSLEQFRDMIRNAIMARSPGTEGAIIQAMILGDQKAIPKAVMENFNRTGTSHIIAISGFNIGMIAIFALFLARLTLKAECILLRWNMARFSMFFAIFVVILYTFIAGAGISVVRASFMITVFMCAALLNRDGDLYNILSLSAFVILLFAPYTLFDISFQLSFAAVASLIFFMPKWLAILPALSQKADACWSRQYAIQQARNSLRGTALFFLASLSATLGTLPLILLYFNRLSLITLLANLVCVPILGVAATPVCLAIILAVPLSGALADWIIGLSEFLVKISLFFIDIFAGVPWASVYISTPSLPEIFAFYILLIWLGLLLNHFVANSNSKTTIPRPILMKAVPAIILLFFLIDGVYIYNQVNHKGNLSLTAVDVAQGNSVLIRLPNGKTILADGGGFFDDSFDLGKFVLAPYLWHERISRIDTVVLTHPHPDHMQGLLFILENFHVREVWTNGEATETELYLLFQKVIEEKGIVTRNFSDMTPLIEDAGVSIRFLNPDDNKLPDLDAAANRNPDSDSPYSGRQTVRIFDKTNDRSLVMKLTFGSHSFLLPADISESVERRLIDSGAALRSDVIFVPHHGSFRSSTPSFVEHVNPLIAVISCGWENVFGFPHPDVLRRYKAVNAQVYRTDMNGAVTITSDGKKISVAVYNPGNS